MEIVFGGRLLILGCGAVSRCLQPLILRHVKMDFSRVTLIDLLPRKESCSEMIQAGATFVQQMVTLENYHAVLSSYVGSGDIVIDLSFNLETIDMIEWCHHHNVRYINAAVEFWNPYTGSEKLISERTLYYRYNKVYERTARWDKIGPSILLDQGANPGLVSHWTKVGLETIATKIVTMSKDKERRKKLERALSDENFPELGLLTGTKVIHISERDTQITKFPKQVNEFVNTWSIDGLYEEATSPAELGWGTHEKTLPSDALTYDFGPRNQICLRKMGMNTLIFSWVPLGKIIGMLIRHGEAFTISNYMTVRDELDSVLYRPTVHYVYLPSNETMNSVYELRMQQYVLQEKKRILFDEISEGADQLGVLLLGHDFNGWWIGSHLTIEQTRALMGPGQNSTTLQVAASALGALFWVINNPERGFRTPDDLPYKEILKVANPYLGDLLSVQTDWTPLTNRENAYKAVTQTFDDKDPWQFDNFRFKG